MNEGLFVKSQENGRIVISRNFCVGAAEFVLIDGWIELVGTISSSSCLTFGCTQSASLIMGNTTLKSYSEFSFFGYNSLRFSKLMVMSSHLSRSSSKFIGSVPIAEYTALVD